MNQNDVMTKKEKNIVNKAIKSLKLPDEMDKSILFTALSHTSFVFEKENKGRKLNSNERLEFLGDSVLELSISEFLFNKYNLSEGDMSKIRATVASELILTEVAKKIHLDKFLFLGTGEEKHGGRQKHSILADATESLFASIYLSLGFDYAKEYILKRLTPYIKKAIKGELFLDHKTKLQEITQEVYKALPVYEVLNSQGPSHIKYYKVAVKINNETLGVGEGHSKKIAEQLAAKEACEKFLNGSNKNEKY
jgi:ribonuclease-3